MSGGSMDYFYSRVEDVAGSIRLTTPLRRAFRSHLCLVAQALHDIEWVDSSDYGPGDEDAAIDKCLAKGAELNAMIALMKETIAESQVVLEKMEEKA